eukprot:452272-Amphidinium_carterae.1
MEHNIWTTHAIVAAARATDHWRQFLTQELQRIADHCAYEDAQVSRRAWLSFAKEEMQQGTKKSYGWLRSKTRALEPSVGIIPQGGTAAIATVSLPWWKLWSEHTLPPQDTRPLPTRRPLQDIDILDALSAYPCGKASGLDD